jgi:hypothetical protein
MKRTGEMHDTNGINQIIEFIRKNSLAREIANIPVLTSKGERFLKALSQTATLQNAGPTGAA